MTESTIYEAVREYQLAVMRARERIAENCATLDKAEAQEQNDKIRARIAGEKELVIYKINEAKNRVIEAAETGVKLLSIVYLDDERRKKNEQL